MSLLLRRALTLALLAPLLGGCRYNFVPLIPPVHQAPLPPRVFGASLERQGDDLWLRARVEGQFQPGYLNVVWYDGARRLGADAVYLDAGQRDAEFRLAAPAPGAYRAVLSLGEQVLRQVELYEVKP